MKHEANNNMHRYKKINLYLLINEKNNEALHFYLRQVKIDKRKEITKKLI